MISIELVLKNEAGLHARPACLFIKEASKFKSDIFIEKNYKQYIAKSLLGILSMAASKGDKIIIKADGEDEKEALEALKLLVDSNFGE